MSRLVVTSVTLDKFGGTQGGRTVVLPSAGLVVLEGPNESGKSTLMEAVAWLLADPTADAGAVARMGRRNDVLEARVEGTVRGVPFVVESSFKVMANDKAKRNETRVTVDGQQTTIEAFRQQIGLVDPSLFHAVFRIEGADGHRVDSVERLIATAGAGVFVGPDPRESAERLKAAAKESGSRTAGSADSVRKREQDIRKLNSELAAQSSKVESYRAAIGTEAGNTRRAEELDALRSSLLAQQAAYGQAAEVVAQRSEAEGIRSAIDDLPEVPADWLPLARGVDGLQELVGRLDDEVPVFRREIAAGASAAERQRRDVTELARFVVPEEVTGRLTGLADAAGAARSEVARLEREADEAERYLHEAAGLADAEVAALGTAAAPVPDPTTADLERSPELIKSAEQVRSALEAVEQATGRASDAVGALRDAEALAAQRQSMFDSLGTGLDADAVVTGRLPAPPGGRTESRDPADRFWWFAPAAFVSLAGVLAAIRQFVVAAVAVGLASVAAFIARRRRSHDVPAPATGADDVVREAALDVRDARRELPTLAAAVSGAERDLQAARERLDRRSEELARALSVAGLPAHTHHSDVSTMLQRWRAAAVAVTARRGWELERDRRRAELEQARVAAEIADRALADAAAPFGIAPGSAPEVVATKLAVLREDVDAARAAVGAQESLDDLHLQLTTMLSGVGLGIDDARAALRTAAEHASTLDERSSLELRAKGLEESVARITAASPTVRELVSQFPDMVSLETHQGQLAKRIEELEGMVSEARNAAAEAKATMNDLLDADEVMGIEQQISSHDAAANDLATEAAAAAIAHLLVVDEIGKEERERQPALIGRTSALAEAVAVDWQEVRANRPQGATGGFDLEVRRRDGGVVPAHQLSTGGRMALYLALRVAVADDRNDGAAALPLLCDDPLVNIDPDRAVEAMQVLAGAAKDRQVIITTCHRSTAKLAERAGGTVVSLNGTS